MMVDIRKRFELMAVRERWLALIMIVATALLGTDIAITDSLRQEIRILKANLNDEKVHIAEVKADIMVRGAELSRDPNDKLREDRSRLQKRLDARRKQTSDTVDQQLIEPERANAVIDYLLNRTPGIALTRMEKLAPELISRASPQKDAKSVEVSFHKHLVTLELEGSYGRVHEMVQQLARRFPTLSFRAFEMKALEYPVNKVTINLAILTHSEDLWNE